MKRAAATSTENGIGAIGCGWFPHSDRGLGLSQPVQRKADPADPEAMSSLIASEMNQLSLKERQSAYEDVHGIPTDNEERPETIDALLKELDQEIAKVRNKQAYDKAMFLNPSYPSDPKFCRMFLRAEDYNVRLTAQRMVLYFKHKMELFGIGLLARRITWEDLDDDDRDSINFGGAQYLDHPDRAGRSVAMMFPHLYKYKRPENLYRAWWYVAQKHLEDNDRAQLNGIVCVAFTVKAPRHSLDVDTMFKSSFLPKCLPLKPKGFHFCYDNQSIRPIMSIIQLGMGPEYRVRFRAHFGSDWECRYALHSFGIRSESLNLHDNDCNINYDAFRSQLQRFREKEEEEKTRLMGRIIHPDASDVLLGRGRPFQDFPGNLKLVELVDSFRAQYQSEGKLQKTALSFQLVEMTKASGGRFLKRSEDGQEWIEVSEEAAKDKVSHSFRTKSKRNELLRFASPVALDDMEIVESTSVVSSSWGANKKQKLDLRV